MRAANGQFIKGAHWRPKAPHWEAAWLREQYVELGRSTGDIAAEAKTTDAAILYWLKKHGIPRRSVAQARAIKHWTVTTKPFKGAHFATFPPDLIEPCILAGCPEGGTVLDPFGGSGTTAGVALKHGRKAILCELNPDYVSMIPARVRAIAGDRAERSTDLTDILA